MHDPPRTAGIASAAGAAAAPSDVGALFEGRPLPRLIVPPLRRQTSVGRRAWLFVLVSWLPLLVLAIVQGQGRSLLHDLGTFARHAVAGPLLLVAEAGCLAVPEDERPRSVERLGDSAQLRHHATLVVLGVALLVIGIVYHVMFMIGLRNARQHGGRRLIHGESGYPPSMTLVAAGLLLLLGLAAIANVVFHVNVFG